MAGQDTEPNGDYNAYGWLYWEGMDSNWYINDWNDGGAASYSSYLCMHPDDADVR